MRVLAICCHLRLRWPARRSEISAVQVEAVAEVRVLVVGGLTSWPHLTSQSSLPAAAVEGRISPPGPTPQASHRQRLAASSDRATLVHTPTVGSRRDSENLSLRSTGTGTDTRQQSNKKLRKIQDSTIAAKQQLAMAPILSGAACVRAELSSSGISTFLHKHPDTD